MRKKRTSGTRTGKTRTAKIITRAPVGSRKSRSKTKTNKTKSGFLSIGKSKAKLLTTSEGLSGFFKGRAFRAVLLVAACLFLGTGAGAGAKAFWGWLTTSDRFAIREIVVRTGEKIPESDVRKLMSITEGDNILSFNLSDCVESVEIHPWVDRASAMRELPDRLVIDIKARKEVATVMFGGLYYVDDKGEIFKRVLPGENADYPVLTGLDLRDAVENKEEVDALIRTGLEIINLSGESKVIPVSIVSEIHLDRIYGATLVRMGDGMRIRFGHGDYENKFTRLEHTLVELGNDAAKVMELDLNYESRVTVRLRDGYRVASADADGPGGL
jgi:cell division protein FtsQ